LFCGTTNSIIGGFRVDSGNPHLAPNLVHQRIKYGNSENALTAPNSAFLTLANSYQFVFLDP